MPRALAPVLVTALLLGGCGWFGDGPDPLDAPRAEAAEFLRAWADEDLAAAAATTDAPEAAEEVLTTTTERLAVIDVATSQGDVEGCGPDDDACTQRFRVTLTMRAAGEWSYDSSLELARTGSGANGTDQWTVVWAPTVVHPQLTGTTRLGRVREVPPRASILDRTGAAITEDRPVVAVGVVPARMTDPAAVYAALQAAADVDPARLAERVAAAGPEEFVDAVVLRQDDYVAASAQLELPGIVTRNGTRSLAPTPEFARAVIGTVAPPTEETLAEAGPYVSGNDLVGASGLQRLHQQALAGTPGLQVVLVDTATEERVGTPLFERAAVPGEPLDTTLDLAVQSAAEAAVAGATKQTAVVALDVATGEVLAAANGPEAGVDRALSGQYPPGSTFKIVSTAALLEAGVPPTEPAACPQTATVEGKRFRNYEFSAYDGGDLATAFARSCNTAFVGLVDRLDASALPAQAERFGIGGGADAWDLGGLPAYAGSVPAPADPVDEAAAMIGQSTVLTSPLAMATVAASVASGTPHPPSLVRGAGEQASAPPAALAPLPPATVDPVRTMMRQAVTDGTATGLSALGEVFAKTGTAEYGSEAPPRTHAWVVGYRGPVAFAVLVEDGASGSAEAVPVAARFLAALPA